MQQRRYLRPLLACLVHRTGAGDALVAAASLVCVARRVHVGSGSISLICAPAACCATLFLAFPYLDMELEFAQCGFREPGLAHEKENDAATEYLHSKRLPSYAKTSPNLVLPRIALPLLQ